MPRGRREPQDRVRAFESILDPDFDSDSLNNTVKPDALQCQARMEPTKKKKSIADSDHHHHISSLDCNDDDACAGGTSSVHF